MPRPHKCRHINRRPTATLFKPAGVPATSLDQIELRIDELEAIRLADLQNLYHDQAAQQMNISRATFGRLLAQAHNKIADALVNGKSLYVTGGNIAMTNNREFQCAGCGHLWTVPFGLPRPTQCPECTHPVLHRTNPGPTSRRGRCGRRGRQAGQGAAGQGGRRNAFPQQKGANRENPTADK